MAFFQKDYNRYRYPRWPLLKASGKCLGRGLIGTLVALYFPIKPLNLLGIGFIVWGYLSWRIAIRPRWRYHVSVEDDGLRINKARHPWKDLQSIHLERYGQTRALKLVFGKHEARDEVRISNKVGRFSELVNQCVWYAERQLEREAELSDQTLVSKLGPSDSTSRTNSQG